MTRCSRASTIASTWYSADGMEALAKIAARATLPGPLRPPGRVRQRPSGRARPLLAVLLIFFVVLVGPACKAHEVTQRPAAEAEARGRGSDTQAGTDTGTGAETLVLEQTWEVPDFKTGVPSVFTDLYVAPGPMLFLVNDGENCEIHFAAGAPNFSPPSFCARSRPGYRLRGYTHHQGKDHVLNDLGRAIVAGDRTGTDLTFSLTG